MKVKVKVIANAKKERILNEGDLLKVYVRSPAVEGKANKRLIETLAGYFKVKKYRIRIVRGETSREKLIDVDNGTD